MRRGRSRTGERCCQWHDRMPRAEKRDEELDFLSRREVASAAVHASVDLAIRANRTHYGELVPIDDTWDTAAEKECGDLGHRLSRWLRSRLSSEPRRRGLVFRALLRKLRQQLAEEGRHLRRLHMALQQAQTMGLEGDHQAGALVEDDEDVEAEAGDLVDQLVMTVGDSSSPQTVLSLLQGNGICFLQLFFFSEAVAPFASRHYDSRT